MRYTVTYEQLPSGAWQASVKELTGYEAFGKDFAECEATIALMLKSHHELTHHEDC